MNTMPNTLTYSELCAAEMREHAREIAAREGIRTEYDRKPIPTDAYDWSAVRDSYEPGWPMGHGRTEWEAIEDLLEQEAA